MIIGGRVSAGRTGTDNPLAGIQVVESPGSGCDRTFSKSIFLDAVPAPDAVRPPTKIASSDSITTYTYHGDLHNLMTTARSEHEKRFGKFDVLAYRDRYLEMSASVEVR